MTTILILPAWANPAGPGACSPDAGSCCGTHTNPGCNSPSCCDAVCAEIPSCCETSWNWQCVSEAFDLPECADCEFSDIPTGLVVIDKTSPAAVAAGLRTYNLHVVFDGPAANLLSVAWVDIVTDDPQGFYHQSQFGGDVPPNSVWCSFIPLVCDDSFVTIGAKSTPPGMASPDTRFNTCSFNCLPQPPCVPYADAEPAECGEIVGGWFNTDPLNGQGLPDENLQVLIAQFTVREGYNVEGTLTVFYNSGTQVDGLFFSTAVACSTDPAACDDADLCTMDFCTPLNPEADQNGCTHADITAQCDDLIDCTENACEPAVGCVFPLLPAGAACGFQGITDCTDADTCNGFGECLPNNHPNGTPCSADADDCTQDMCSGGFCAHPPAAVGTPCGDQSDTACSNPNTCSGFGGCSPNNEPSGTPCGDQADSACNNPDTCNGFGVCSPNIDPNGAPCSADGGPCLDDVCAGGMCIAQSSCPGDVIPDGTVGPTDLAVVLAEWGPGAGLAGDANCDGVVNAADLALLLGAWGPCD